MPKRKNTGSTDPNVPVVIQTTTLDTLATQLNGLAEILAKTQQEVQEAKGAASSLTATNDSLRQEIAAAKSSADEACTSNATLRTELDEHRFRQERPVKFDSKGNEDQYNIQIKLLDLTRCSLSAFRDGRPNDLEHSLLKSDESIVQRIKHIRLAEESPYGWLAVREFLGSSIVSNEAEDIKFKKAEAVIEAKIKKKQDATRGGRGNKRGAYRGRGGYSGQNVVYQQVPGSNLNQAAANNVIPAYIPNPAVQVAAAPNKGIPQGYIKAPRVLGPCHWCQGPHLQKHCPVLAQLTASAQSKVETVYYTQ